MSEDKNIVAERLRSAKAAGMSERDAVLVSMKRVPEKKSKDAKSDLCCSAPCSASEYPWGLTINLENESLNKLEFGDELPKVGSTVKIVAEAKVESVSSRSDKDNKSNRTVSLQIVKMAVK